MTNKIPYKTFSSYVLRTPLFSFDFYNELTSEKSVSEKQLKKLCSDPVISEALFLASPDLHLEIMKWINNEMSKTKDIDKLKRSIVKYLIRMSSRCTPFGLFAGCCLGTFSNQTNIRLKAASENKRHTRLDMNFLVALSQDLVNIPKIREQIFFFPNTSIYKIGNQLRYVEYNYLNGKRMHHISAVNSSVYLDQVFKTASEGALLANLALSIVEDDINLEDATNFIDELVNNQLLISDLEPSVSGPEFLRQICTVLETLKNVEDILNVLIKANKTIVEIDKAIGNDPKVYLKLYEELKKLGGNYELKFMFQTDLVIQTHENTLEKDIINSLNKGLTLLNRITLPRTDTLLQKFIDSFSERYGEKEIPLSMALDVEVGLGYKQNVSSGDISPLVDNLVFAKNTPLHKVKEISLTSIDMILQKRLVKAFKENEYTVALDDKMFEGYDADWDDLPDTFSCMIELFKIDGQDKIKLNYLGGSSAANLLGRFCHGDKEIFKHTRKIIDVETIINNNKILAEIVHLPESRVGNILMRPSLRKYEIPYLSKSLKSKEHRIPIEDLMISVKRNKKILLKSKKENKEIVPHLTNAHNFSSDALPIYNFLSDMQTQGIRSQIGFHWGPFADEYEFLPRVEYENIILKEASWNLTKKHIENLTNSTLTDDVFIKEIAVFREKFQIPKYILIGHRDNKLVVNFENLDSVLMFLKIANKEPKFSISEFLFAENTAVKGNGVYYANQIIVSYFNEAELTKKNKNDGQ